MYINWKYYKKVLPLDIVMNCSLKVQYFGLFRSKHSTEIRISLFIYVYLYHLTLSKIPKFPRNAITILQICKKKTANDNFHLRGPCLAIQQLSQFTHMEFSSLPFPIGLTIFTELEIYWSQKSNPAGLNLEFEMSVLSDLGVGGGWDVFFLHEVTLKSMYIATFDLVSTNRYV